MARLSAYYQEDFHYPPVGYGRKQKKSAYVFYEEPRHGALDGNRGLGASEPTLTPYGAFPLGELFDNEPFCDAAPYDDRHHPRFKPRERSRKRFSYAEPHPNAQRHAALQQREYCDYGGRIMTHPDNYYLHPQAAFYPGDGRQREPWTWTSPAFLSPPSPLDSGLSSQSSPSLEVESYPLVRSQRHRTCLCPRTEYYENSDRCLSRFDSGRSSPGGYSSSFPTPRPGSRAAHVPPPDAFSQHPPRSHVRYGKLGIVGERESRVEERRALGKEGRSTPRLVDPGRSSERASSPEKSAGSESPMSVTDSVGSSDGAERRRAAERDIRELEEMVARCGLGDRDLLDRAERRDLPTAHQRLARSSSDTLYETMRPLNPHEAPRRAPPRRRSGLPDRVADDMALRKLRRPEPRPCAPRSTTTYMLCSSHFTPSVAVGRDILLLDNPDVDLDDLSYRTHYLGRQSRVQDPQPPFGIPLRPPQRVHSDYLHAVPSRAPQPLCHPRGNPDVVRDDMAFRTLRKEHPPPESIYCDIAHEKKR